MQARLLSDPNLQYWLRAAQGVQTRILFIKNFLLTKRNI